MHQALTLVISLFFGWTAALGKNCSKPFFGYQFQEGMGPLISLITTSFATSSIVRVLELCLVY
ncbi:hypothetical protein I3760_05G108700 [Carya illinoinensis]|nr:hypothetical protein I3760_05G108700 [Carya illinoinensis]